MEKVSFREGGEVEDNKPEQHDRTSPSKEYKQSVTTYPVLDDFWVLEEPTIVKLLFW